MKKHRIKIERWTPPRAAAVLKQDLDRGPRWRSSPAVRRRVAYYARQMRAGRWILAAQPIVFSADGFLIDGAIRLLALVRSRQTLRLRTCVLRKPLEARR